MQQLVERLNIPARLGNVTSPYHENGWVITSDKSGQYTDAFFAMPGMAQLFAYHVNDLVDGERGWNLEAFRVTHNGHSAIEAVFHSSTPVCFEKQVEETTQRYVGRNILRMRLHPYQDVTRFRTNYFLDVKNALNPSLIKPVAAKQQDNYTDYPTVFTAEPVSIPPFLTLPDLMEMIGNPRTPVPRGISRFYIQGMEFRAFPFQVVRVTENAELVSIGQNVPRLWTRIVLQEHRPVLEAVIEKLPEEAEDKLKHLKELRRQVLNQAITPINREIRKLTDSRGNYSPAKIAAMQDKVRLLIEASETNIDPTHLLPKPE